MADIAFIGLGNMGLPMALNLVRAGHGVTGFDLSPAAREAATAAGLTLAESALDGVRRAQVVVTMLPAGKHVRAVWEKIVGAVPKGALLIDSSTIDVESARAVHELAGAQGLLALDAPVSGGTGGAVAGTLTFMCGGTAEAFAAGKPVLEAMGKRIVHCGGAGAGQAAKVCNNMILGATMVAPRIMLLPSTIRPSSTWSLLRRASPGPRPAIARSPARCPQAPPTTATSPALRRR